MNYRHAYHAGNFADVMKHALLVRILCHLRIKDTPFRVIDTHAGIGLYDLDSDEARRAAEWLAGIGRLAEHLDADVEDLIRPYRDAIEAVRSRHGEGAYPGSPSLVRELLRPQDQGVAVELHPEDFARLKARYEAVPNLKTLHLDGWTALRALIPPKEKRGLVLIDPPYEKPDELERLTAECLKAVRKWPTGIYAAWYPIKAPGPIDEAARRLAEACARPALRLELYVERPDRPDRLNGCGLFVINPPWTLQGEAETILRALAKRLARGDYGGYRCEALPQGA